MPHSFVVSGQKSLYTMYYVGSCFFCENTYLQCKTIAFMPNAVKEQGPVVQSIISLKCLLADKMLTVLHVAIVSYCSLTVQIYRMIWTFDACMPYLMIKVLTIC